MLFPKDELEEMLGYSLEQLDVTLFETSNEFVEYDLDKEDLTLLFERVREQTWADAQEQLMEWGN